jgi:hypothetical protein
VGRDYGLLFDPAVYRATQPPSKLHRSAKVVVPRAGRRFGTPRHGISYPQQYLTRRSIGDLPIGHPLKHPKRSPLPTQVRFERGTDDATRKGTLSADFVEYLMDTYRGRNGPTQPAAAACLRYPPDWTVAA